MVGRVAEEHQPHERLAEEPFWVRALGTSEDPLQGPEVERRRVGLGLVAAERGVAESGGDVCVAGEDPDPEGAAVDRVQRPGGPEERIGVAPQGRRGGEGGETRDPQRHPADRPQIHIRI